MLTPEQQRYDPDGDPFAADDRAVNAELAALRQQNQCLLGQLATVRDGSNAHAANLTRMAKENVELHAEAEARDAEILTCWELITRYKKALEIYKDDGNWTYNTANDDCIWARDEHGATTAARALHEDGEQS